MLLHSHRRHWLGESLQPVMDNTCLHVTHACMWLVQQAMGMHVSEERAFMWLQASTDKAPRCLQNKPQHPAELAADVVDRVLATDGDMYLETMRMSCHGGSCLCWVSQLSCWQLLCMYVLLQRVNRLLCKKYSYRHYGKNRFDKVPGGT